MRTAVSAVAVPAAALVTLVTLTACGAGDSPAGPDRSLTVAVDSLPTEWDPIGQSCACVFGMVLGEPVYESIVVLDNETLEYEPWLAEEYTIDEDRRSMSVTLRDDVEFTDGEHLTAEAFASGFEQIIAGGTNYVVNEFAPYGVEIEVTGEYTFVISTTSGINTRFMDALTFVPVVSPAALEDHESLATAPVGTGPYVIDETVPEVSMTFVRNPDYWNPDAYDFETVTYLVFSDRVASLNALKSGQIDAAELDLSAVSTAEADGFGLAVGAGTIANIVWMDRTATVSPAIGDVRVRQAISLAFDREAINDTLNYGYGEARSQTFVEGQPQYIEGGDDRYAYDLERARELMAEAGYEDGFDLVFPTFSALPSYEPIIQQSLADIGIRVTFEHLADGDVIGALSSKRYPLILLVIGDSGLLAYIADGGVYSGFGPADPIIVDLLDRIDNGAAEDSAEASQELGELLLGEAWYIPISHQQRVWGLAEGVEVQAGDRAGWPISLRNFSATP